MQTLCQVPILTYVLQTYVAWNVHEVLPQQYNWTGFADLERYIQLIDKLGMLVLLRPGPYICAEWDFGGFPAWLASEQVRQPPLGTLIASPASK